MPNFRKIQIDVEKHSGTYKVYAFDIRVRLIPESGNANNWTSFKRIGRTDEDGTFIWDKAIAGARYEFEILAVDDRLALIFEQPLIKQFTCDPPAPDSIQNVRAELDE